MMRHANIARVLFFLFFFLFLLTPDKEERPLVMPLPPLQNEDTTNHDPLEENLSSIATLAPIVPQSRPLRTRATPRLTSSMDVEAARSYVEGMLSRALPSHVAVQSRFTPQDKGRIIRGQQKKSISLNPPLLFAAHDTATIVLTTGKTGSVIAFYRLKAGDSYLPPVEGEFGIITDDLSALTLYKGGEEIPLFQTNDNDASAIFFN